ncbi:hypothetical protein F5887DRAFT_1076177 [Amanita rubescens]|nr:hypothetical protein F5887DRAFT_1076177 [Amanita rubescens]
MLSPVEVYLIAITTQALVTGAYFASFLVCLRWLIFSDDGRTTRKRIHWPLLIIAIILFAFSVTDLGITLQTTLLVFGDRPGSKSYTIDSDIAYFIEMLAPIITDSVLIFRCWAVYDRSWRIVILPLLLLLYNISCLILLTYWTTTTSGAGESESFADQFLGILESNYASTIAINIYATSVIILKIWTKSFPRSLSRLSIRVIAESGLLYTLASIAAFCALLLSPDTAFLIANAISFPTSLIAYNLILIRVAQNRASTELEGLEIRTSVGNSTMNELFPPHPQKSETLDFS